MTVSVGQSSFRRDTLLARLPRESYQALEALWREDTLEEGQLIIGEGDTDNDMFFVLEGEVRAAVFTIGGKEVAFRDIGAGDCFGEIAAIDKQSRVSSVIARGEATVARLAARDFDNQIATDAHFATELLRLLAGKLRGLSSRVVEFAELTGAQRVRRELLRLAKDHRKGLDEAVIKQPPTQGELATMIFVRREVVAREMAALGRRGVVVRRAGALHVASIRGLEAEAAKDLS